MRKSVEHIMHKVLHILEFAIALLTLLVLLTALGYEVYRMCTVPGDFAAVDNYLQNVLAIVVGLEFVRMLIDLTPANTIEVLIVAIARQVILSHNDPVSNLICIVCIAGLFATRRFRIPRQAMKKELSEME